MTDLDITNAEAHGDSTDLNRKTTRENDQPTADTLLRRVIGWAGDEQADKIPAWVIDDLQNAIRTVIRAELASLMAAALADPDVGEVEDEEYEQIIGVLTEAELTKDQAEAIGACFLDSYKTSAKAIAGYLLQKLGK